MAVAPGGVGVEGLRDLAKALKAMNATQLIKEVKQVNFEAAEMVIAAARQNASTAMQRSTASRLKATRTAAYAAVRMGGQPFDMGSEFGAYRNILRVSQKGRVMVGWNHFEPWRGNDTGAGYFLYPAIRKEVPPMNEKYADWLEQKWFEYTRGLS